MEPTNEEMKRGVIDVIRHSVNVEYYLKHVGLLMRLDLGMDDPERPHDIAGPYNKLEWEVARGMALVYREPKPDFNLFILPSIELHRGQNHHQKWNYPSSRDKSLPNPTATIRQLFSGAIDAACSMIEARMYGGGSQNNEQFGREHSWEELEADGFAKFDIHKRPYVALIVKYMRQIPPLDLSSIKNPSGKLHLAFTENNTLYPYMDKEWYKTMEVAIEGAITKLEKRGYVLREK